MVYDELDIFIGFIFFPIADSGVASYLICFLALCVHDGDFCIIEDVFFGVGLYNYFFDVFDVFNVNAKAFHHLLELPGVHFAGHHRYYLLLLVW